MNALQKFLLGLISKQGGGKTYLAGFILLVTGANHLLVELAKAGVQVNPFLSPGIETTLLMLGGGLGVIGLGHKTAKAKAAAKELADVYREGIEAYNAVLAAISEAKDANPDISIVVPPAPDPAVVTRVDGAKNQAILDAVKKPGGA